MIQSMRKFTFDQAASRVVFGVDAFDTLADEVKLLGGKRALVLSTPEQEGIALEASRRLGAIASGVFPRAVMHVPIETAREARETARRLNADCCVAVGGGSTIGLGKAIALESGLPILAVPTTYAGSEVTPIYGLTEDGLKKTGRDRKVLPKTVIYDPKLTLTLPPKIAGPSGMNAIAHCIEGLYAPDGNPIMTLFAAEGIRALAQALPRVIRAPEDIDARAEALYGAWLSGIVLGAVSIGIHHKLCHTLGGTFNLPHAEVHTVILPHAARFNAETAPEAMRIAANALGVDDAPRGLYDLAQSVGAPIALKQIGMPAHGLERAAELATQNPYANPRPVEYNGVLELLRNAYAGARP